MITSVITDDCGPMLSKLASDDPISEPTYRGLCELIHRHSRIHLGANRHSMLASRLNLRRQSLGLKSWDLYYNHLLQYNNQEEINTLIDLIATNHTQFFRERSHFERLQTEILDCVLTECPGASRQLVSWSAATSSGEEAYSLAITIQEYLQGRVGAKPDWLVHASDISRKALRIATEAIYPSTSLNLPKPEWLARYFRRGSGPYEGKCRVKPVITDRVRLKQINLFQQTYPLPQPIHLIFCRNVLIYFAQDSQEQLVERLHGMLCRGGFLVVGHSDSLACIRHDFESLGGGIFRRSH
ncbi:MAG: protein-glutamate O-methyltransferase CheR [Cyanobacteriota bacterium]|nr:protein-glutamate O-methyltransferase CheR [Cyanobacteriota bacterium]